MSAETLVSRFYAEAARIPDAPALMVKSQGAYREVAWREMEQRVRAIAAALIGLGVQLGDRVGILSENRQEWIEADFAIMSVGAITVALHAALTASQVREQFADAAPVVVFVSNREQLDKLLAARDALPSVRRIVAFDASAAEDGSATQLGEMIDRDGPHAKNLSAAERVGVTPDIEQLNIDLSRAAPLAALLEQRIREVEPGDTAAIIYTSGTTGESKGVMLTHSNFVSNVDAVLKRQPPEDLDEQAVTLVYLPLSHVYARLCDLYIGLRSQRALALADNIESLFLNLQEVRPHYMIGVPRVYEKIVAAARERIEAGDPNGLRNVLGGRIRWCSGGGAAVSPEIVRFFFGAGVPIYQGYGLTETSPVISMSCAGQSKIGASGTVVEGVEVKIAPDGEILSRGPHIMKGYWNRPQATAEAIDSEGWFHTGDVGRLDGEGFLFITDRKKDIFVSSYGKNIAPQLIEGLLGFDEFIEHACVYGDGKKHLTALVVPAAPKLLSWAGANGITGETVADFVKLPEVHTFYSARIAKALANLAPYEQIRDFVLLSEPFSPASGTMTSTAKLRRKQIIELHRDALEALYEN